MAPEYAIKRCNDCTPAIRKKDPICRICKEVAQREALLRKASKKQAAGK